MDLPWRPGVALDHMPPGEWLVDRGIEPATARDIDRFAAHPRIGRPPAPVAEDDRRSAVGRRRHRVAVDQQRTPEALDEQSDLAFDRAVVRAVRLVETFVELVGSDRPPPQETVLLRARRDDPETAASAGGHPAPPRPVDNRRIDIVLRPIAVDRRARSPRDHGAAAALKRSPYQPVDQRIFQSSERGPARRSAFYQPIGIIAARVRHREQHRQGTSGIVEDWRG